MTTLTKKEREYIEYFLKEQFDRAERHEQKAFVAKENNEVDKAARYKRLEHEDYGVIKGISTVLTTIGYSYTWDDDDNIHLFKTK